MRDVDLTAFLLFYALICNLVQEKCISVIGEFSFTKGYDITVEKVMEGKSSKKRSFSCRF